MEEHDAIKQKPHCALVSLILEHDFVRKVCNFSGSCSKVPACLLRRCSVGMSPPAACGSCARPDHGDRAYVSWTQLERISLTFVQRHSRADPVNPSSRKEDGRG